MGLSYRDSIAVAELAFYGPAILIGIYLTAMHPFHTAGFIDIVFFSGIRIAGSVVQIKTISNPTESKLYTIAAIMNSIGLAPLLAGSLGLLDRLNENIGKNNFGHIHRTTFRIIQLDIITGLVLGIIGGIHSGSSLHKNGVFSVGTVSKVGTALLIAGLVADIILALLTTRYIRNASSGYKRLLLAVFLALPFLSVRLVYTILATLTTDQDFNFVSGSVTDWLCMAVLEEVVVVIIYIVVGLSMVPVLNRQRLTGGSQTNGFQSTSRHAVSLFRKIIFGGIVRAARETRDKE
ncbi:hypothetical protein F5884DRAFT_731182 [Xylogone sp. PMI_703]|nr:hypothetical protein F5884DRAFT_731182 [Xylogone sp. PMI_703]